LRIPASSHGGDNLYSTFIPQEPADFQQPPTAAAELPKSRT